MNDIIYKHQEERIKYLEQDAEFWFEMYRAVPRIKGLLEFELEHGRSKSPRELAEQIIELIQQHEDEVQMKFPEQYKSVFEKKAGS